MSWNFSTENSTHNGHRLIFFIASLSEIKCRRVDRTITESTCYDSSNSGRHVEEERVLVIESGKTEQFFKPLDYIYTDPKSISIGGS